MRMKFLLKECRENRNAVKTTVSAEYKRTYNPNMRSVKTQVGEKSSASALRHFQTANQPKNIKSSVLRMILFSPIREFEKVRPCLEKSPDLSV